MNIGIAGFGFVGQAVASCVKGDITIYDPPIGEIDHSQLFKCDIIFCCLPTPSTGGAQDFGPYEAFFSVIPKKFRGILVIKSTVLYSNVVPYLGKFTIVLNPKFLSQNNADEDFANQKLIVLGGRIDHCKRVAQTYKESFALRKNPEFYFCSEKEACEIKYLHNIYHAYKVLFWNYALEITGNHRKIFDAYSRITGNTFEMQQVGADGKLGYGGACFPKDVAAFHHAHPHALTEFMRTYNEFLRNNK